MLLSVTTRSLNRKIKTIFDIRLIFHKFCFSSLIISIGILVGGCSPKQAVILKVSHHANEETKDKKEIIEKERNNTDPGEGESPGKLTSVQPSVDLLQGDTLSLQEKGLKDRDLAIKENLEEPFPIVKSKEEPSIFIKQEREKVESREDIHFIPQEEKVSKKETGIPFVINKDVLSFIDYFRYDIRPRFELWLSRSTKYETIIKDILKEYDLPEELFYLALIESGFSPHAVSARKAVGLWQFMKFTAKRYGLTINGWIDERRDVIRATKAAAQYLKDLYEQFQNWELVLAAYNAGEGKIANVIQKYGITDFWELRKRPCLKKETIEFVPKFMAAWAIAKDPDIYGFSNLKFQEPLSYDVVTLKGGTSMKVIANAIGCDLDTLKELNPHIRKESIPPYHPGFPLRLPKGKMDLFMKNYLAKAENDGFSSKRHVVRPGETLQIIAMKYGTSPETLMKLNGIKNPNLIKRGMSLVVSIPPSRIGESSADRLAKVVSTPERAKGLKINKGDLFYSVRQGDTLWKIAKKHDLSISEICELNNLKEDSVIRPGDKLIIKSGNL